MAIFSAGAPVNMNIITDLAVLASGTTHWTSGLGGFAAVSGNHATEIDANGIFNLGSSNAPPPSGFIQSLSVHHGAATAYTISGLAADFASTVSDVQNLGAYNAFADLLSGNDVVTGSQAADLIHGFNGNDTIGGRGGNDKIFGDAGNDTLNGGEGKDLIDGGDGFDTALYNNFSKPISVTLSGAQAAIVSIGGVATDTLKNVERVLGGSVGDHLTGDGASNSLLGNDGRDFLAGRGGNDILAGGRGSDVLTGGAAQDTFYFNTALNAKANVDTIVDFNHADDVIYLSHGVFTKLAIGSNDFFAVGLPHDHTDRIIYNPTTGYLTYDANADAPGAGVAFAHLAKNLALDSSDFFVTA
jgi:Ca2+-binding RTX toxin-like protein